MMTQEPFAHEIETATDFMKHVNRMSFDNLEFAKVMTTHHRTLQQNAFRAMMACIVTWAEMEHYDARNEATVKACKKIVERLSEEERYLPFI